MMLTGSARKVLLVSDNEELQQKIDSELKQSGIPVHSLDSGKSLSVVLQKSNNIILIDPSYDEVMNDTNTKWNPHTDRFLFIFTDDERWKQKADGRSVFFLPTNTHPMELARLLVEKLNLPSVSNKPAYAFSFFQF
jgi:hypothetical protein